MSTSKVEDAYPLSPMQEGMLFHSLNLPEYEIYTVQLSCRLAGLDPARWKRAWQLVAQRHTVLRTAFAWKSLRRPLQLVGRQAPIPWEEHDWSRLPQGEQQMLAEEYLENDRRRGFDLSHAPLMRMALMRLDDGDYRFIWCYHHIILDAWSGSMVMTEVLRVYQELHEHPDLHLPIAPSFRSFIDLFAAHDTFKAEEFWRRMLSGFSTATPLGGVPGEAIPRFEDAFCELTQEETASVMAAARRYQLTLNTLLLGAWGLVLSRYSGEDDVLFGSTVAGRPLGLPGVEQMVGLFINTLPVRLQVPPDAQVLRWLRHLQDLHLSIREHEQSSLVDIHGFSDVPRGEPLFESIVIVENLPAGLAVASQRSQLRVEQMQAHWLTSYPLSLMVVPGSVLKLQFMYDRERFHPWYIEGMLRNLRRVLLYLLADPARLLVDLPMEEGASGGVLPLGGAMRHSASTGSISFVHDAIVARATEHPDAIALRFGSERLTYRELEQRSRSLAARLRSAGVGPEIPVGLLLERSPSMVVALLAILRAGGAYVPLDPVHPPERLAAIIAGSGVSLVITREALLCRVPLPSSVAALIYRVEEGEGCHDLPALPGADAVGLHPENLAYLIYTSGSTGAPKGVMVEHRALLNVLGSMSSMPGIGRDDRFLAITTISFDIATLEILLPLMTGAELLLAPEDIVADGARLADLLEQGNVTMMQATPATWRMLLDAGWRGRRELSILCGGEYLPRELADRLLGCCGALWNMYGPTETTIWSCVQKVAAGAGPIPLGHPIKETTIHLLDRHMRHVPEGVAGELCIGGAGLARGYMGLPALTAEQFIFVRSSGMAEVRLYRTGDIARIDPDGNLEFLGRMDAQVKIRGFRVEPGEIESAMMKHPAVREAVVIPIAEGMVTRMLAGFIVAAPGEIPTLGQLRGYLLGRLPAYMVPLSMQFLPEMPRTSSGKTDRRALLAMAQLEPARGYLPPRTPLEEMVAGLFAEVLGVNRVGLYDDFFELGGHSLTVTQLIARLNRTLGLLLPLRTVFQRPTPGSLAAAIAAALQGKEEPWLGGEGEAISPIPHVPPGTAIPASLAQQRLLFLDHLGTDRLPYNLLASVRLRGLLDTGALRAAVAGIVCRHDILRTTFRYESGGPVQLIARDGFADVRFVDLRNMPDRDAVCTVIMAEEAHTPFDLTTGPLFRPMLVRLADEEHILLLAMHHIISDAWSIGIIIREAALLYEAALNGAASPLRPLPLQYGDYAMWQRERLAGELLRRQLDYWRETLRGVEELRLPFDRPRPAVETFRGANHLTEIPLLLVQALKNVSRQQHVTLFVILMAAFKTLLHHYTGQHDIVVGTMLAGRERSELEELIGFFANTLTLRTTLAGNPRFRELLRREFDVLLGAFAHREIPFDRIVEELRPERDPGRNPLFHVMFILQNTPAPPTGFGGLLLEPIVVENGSVEFDMLLELYETATGMTIRCSYSTDLFDAATIARFAASYRLLLEEIVCDVDAPIESISFLPEEDRASLVQLFNERL